MTGSDATSVSDGGGESTHKNAVRTNAWERLSFAVIRGVLRLHTSVWGWSGLYATCKAFGTLEYLINFKRRGRVRQMMKAILGPEAALGDIRRSTRAQFMRQRCEKAFYLVFDTLPTNKLKRRFEITNRHLLDEGLERGKGVYVMLSHLGSQHVCGQLLCTLGYRVGGVRHPNEGGARRFLQDLWEQKHPELPRTRYLYSGDFVRDIYRMFGDNYVLGSALDVSRDRGRNLRTVEVDILGHRGKFLTGTLQIALRCNATVVQGFVVSEDNYNYRLELHGPMTDPENDRDTPELLQDVMQRYADNITQYMKKYPDHVTRVSGGIRGV